MCVKWLTHGHMVLNDEIPTCLWLHYCIYTGYAVAVGHITSTTQLGMQELYCLYASL